MSRLPPELLHATLVFADTSTQRSCSLVCKVWSHVAQPVLLRSIRFDMLDAQRVSSSLSLTARDFVRRIIVFGARTPLKQKPKKYACAASLATFLGSCSRASTIVFELAPTFPTFNNVLIFEAHSQCLLACAPRITHLSIGDISIVPDRQIPVVSLRETIIWSLDTELRFKALHVDAELDGVLELLIAASTADNIQALSLSLGVGSKALDSASSRCRNVSTICVHSVQFTADMDYINDLQAFSALRKLQLPLDRLSQANLDCIPATVRELVLIGRPRTEIDDGTFVVPPFVTCVWLDPQAPEVTTTGDCVVERRSPL